LIKDVIAILDSDRIQRDMVPDVNFVQLTNRVPIPHPAMERGFKKLIAGSGANRQNTLTVQKPRLGFTNGPFLLQQAHSGLRGSRGSP